MKKLILTTCTLIVVSAIFAQFPDEWIFDIRSNPYVLTNPNQSITIELELYEDKDIAEINMANCDNYNHLGMDGATISTLVLKDDGVGQDAVAGDLIYTSQPLQLLDANTLGGTFTISNCDYNMLLNDGTTLSYSDVNFFASEMNFTIRVSTITEPDIPELYQLSDDVQYTNHVVNVRGKGEPQENYACQRFYEYFPDDRQFVYLASLYLEMWDENPHSRKIQALEQGIDYYGDPNYDITADFGSAGALERVIYFPDGAETNFGVWVHETQHRWTAFLDIDLGLSDASHHFVGGFRPGYTIVQINDTTYQFVNNPEANYSGAGGCFNDLTMYLAGLAPFDNIPFPFQVLQDYQWDWLTDTYTSTAGIREVTAEEFLNSMGPRIPAFEDARKDFKGIFIVNSERFLSAEEMYFFEKLALKWQQNDAINENWCGDFYSITHGQATMDMRVSEPLTASENIAMHTKHFNIYPNPSFDRVTIKGIPQNSFVQIADITGHVVKEYYNVSSELSLPEKFNPGLYFVLIKSPNGLVMSGKMIRQ